MSPARAKHIPTHFRSHITRSLTLLVAVAAVGYASWAIWTAGVLSTGAPLAWRFHLFLAEGGPLLLLAVGLLLTTGQHPRLRHLGWGLVLATILGQLLWTGIAVAPHALVLGLGPILVGTLTPAPTPPLDPATRDRLVEAAYRQHSDALFRYAVRYGQRWSAADSLAEDVVQDTFLALHVGQHDDVLTRDAAGLRAHLFSTVKRRLQTAIRSEDRRAHYEAAAIHDMTTRLALAVSPAAQQGGHELAERIQLGLAHCPPRAAEAFHLVVECGLSYAEAGLVMHISPKTVGSHLVEAIRRILPYVRDWLPPAPEDHDSTSGDDAT